MFILGFASFFGVSSFHPAGGRGSEKLNLFRVWLANAFLHPGVQTEKTAGVAVQRASKIRTQRTSAMAYRDIHRSVAVHLSHFVTSVCQAWKPFQPC